MKNNQISIEFDSDKEELVDFFRFHLVVKENNLLISIIASIIITAIGLVSILVFHEQVLGLILFAIAIIILLVFPIQLRKALKRQVNSTYVIPKQKLEFSNDAIKQITPKKTNEYKWNEVIEVDETSKYIYVYVSKYRALILSKKSFTDEIKDELYEMFKIHNCKTRKYKH